MPEKITIACFGLSGFGNDLLDTLYTINDSNLGNNQTEFEIECLYTRKNKSDHLYYSNQSLETLAEKHALRITYVPQKGDWDCAPADLAIVSTFHRILKTKHLSRFNRIINIHPSLLPSYQGATPTHWMIENNETIVGVSAHLMKEEVDSGPIIFQKKMLNPQLNDNQLRKALSFLSKEIVRDIVNNFPNYTVLSSNYTPSSQPPRSTCNATLNLNDITSINTLISHIQCYTPHPMPKLEVDKKIFIIDFTNPTVTLNITVASENFALMGYWE
ncbi:MAG: hypothetical protein COB51_09160 [Moraxellaceae bacterium]|nr:MAG: hypothetical protein COB51_09160 [Moraxellaceae bacterium]